MFNIKDNLKTLPDVPGVYMHKDKLGQVIYVGKAISLKNRVRQYFQSYGQSTPKLRALVSQIAEFEYITCSSEMEALILECNLIKRYMPKYNVLLRDDKTYPYIKVTTKEDFPRVIKTRILDRDGNKYFGPYSDVSAVNDTIDMLNSVFALKRCTSKVFPPGHSPCLNYHIKECKAPCCDKITKEEYKKSVKEVINFLNGDVNGLINRLKMDMNQAASNLSFEKAAKIRNQIAAIKVLEEKQRVTMTQGKDMDIVIPICTDLNSSVALFPVRDGKLLGRELFPMTGDMNKDKVELVDSFIKQYYSQWAKVPPEILINVPIDNITVLEGFLSKEGHKVRIYQPKKGDKKALLNLAQGDAIELAKTLDDKIKAKEEKNHTVKSMLDQILTACEYGIADGEYRVEAYDISNTNGVDSVGGMVVFQGLKPVKKDYRRFKIKTIEGPDDYGSLREMLLRRFKRALNNDSSFNVLPDIILMDGGKGQVSSAESVLKELKLDIPVLGMAKDDSHRTRALISTGGIEILLKDYPLLFKYVGTIQEEVHRFAISYHHKLHSGKAITSVLDNINGVGPAKRNALLAHFNSVENIKNADITQLMEVNGITSKVAENIIKYFS